MREYKSILIVQLIVSLKKKILALTFQRLCTVAIANWWYTKYISRKHACQLCLDWTALRLEPARNSYTSEKRKECKLIPCIF